MQDQMIDVSIQIKTEIKDENGEETITRKENGQYVHKEGFHVLKYEEHIEEIGDVSTTLIIQDSKITLKREGAIKMQQIFRIGKHTESVYYHPYGSFRMETETYRMEFHKSIDNKMGKLFIVYDVIMNEEEPRNYTLAVEFEEEDV
ncbi:hypothetical protein CEY16_10560 [Halalkalibacillus sediminis]|uniref:DUF1934 domain-containing protein n=1 Tax=Halalkalibacillus sediminis TaxID=2018042 RepID=A0A2I0QS86_9BACI|nr:DUF1934 domain-containing protein [Halalkalibacillus sediminis]PKR77174.1 hypothetical protein CEY16_10560 [Halalkalibacillus sediminis]